MRRPPRLPSGAIGQQSMALDRSALSMEGAMPGAVLGVVLSVNRSDSPQNRTAFQRSDLRGYLHEASVLVMLDGQEPYLRLDNVVICPDGVSGLDNYEERLPRPCSQTVSGDSFNGNLNGINPYDLDGDWCVVSFIGGSIRQPFISRWWPHPRNPMDPQTSGTGSPDSSGRGRTLDQTGRVFSRVNGLETVITQKGDLYFSTRFANSSLDFSRSSSTEGRFARQESDDDGGSVQIDVKPSQVLAINFNPQVEGAHRLSGFEDDLPQTNPRVSRSVQSRSSDDTKVTLSRTDIRLSTSQTVDVKSTEDVILTGNQTVQVNGDEQVQIESPDIQLGTTAPEKLIMGETYSRNTDTVLTTFAATLTALKSAITAATTVADMGTAVNNALDQLLLMQQQLQSQIDASLTTKAKAE